MLLAVGAKIPSCQCPHALLLLCRGLFEFGEYAFLAVYRDSYGMTFSSLTDKNNGVITTWIILAVEWWVFMVLAWYLEQVLANGTGNRRHPLFFLDYFRKVSQTLLSHHGLLTNHDL